MTVLDNSRYIDTGISPSGKRQSHKLVTKIQYSIINADMFRNFYTIIVEDVLSCEFT